MGQLGVQNHAGCTLDKTGAYLSSRKVLEKKYGRVLMLGRGQMLTLQVEPSQGATTLNQSGLQDDTVKSWFCFVFQTAATWFQERNERIFY